jgi:hypothetical protein
MYLNNPSAVCPYAVERDARGAVVEAMLLEVARRVVPSWASVADGEAAIAPLTGGITNVLFKLSKSSEPDSVIIVRLFGEGTSLFVDRDRENFVFSELSRLGVGSPTFHGLFENGRIEGYLAARALTPDELHDQPALLLGADGSLLEAPVAAASLSSVARALSPTTALAVPATPMSGWLLAIFPFPATTAPAPQAGTPPGTFRLVPPGTPRANAPGAVSAGEPAARR